MGDNTNMIMLKNVRCSFPQLWKEDVKDGQTFGRGITLLLDKTEHAAKINAIRSAMQLVADESSKLKGILPEDHMLCLKKAPRNRAEYGDVMVLKAGAQRTPLVLLDTVDPVTKQPMRATEETDKIFSGCYVNAKIDIWGQDNKYGQRINAKIIAVQFAAPGESFDGSYVPEEVAAEGFDAIEGEEDPFG